MYADPEDNADKFVGSYTLLFTAKFTGLTIQFV